MVVKLDAEAKKSANGLKPWWGQWVSLSKESESCNTTFEVAFRTFALLLVESTEESSSEKYRRQQQ
jgi:hypothetical protein